MIRRLLLSLLFPLVVVTPALADCQSDLAATAEYAGLLRGERQSDANRFDVLLRELASLRARNAALDARVKELEKKTAPTAEVPMP